MALRTGSGWGYALDYDKEIATDLKNLADIERYLALGIFAHAGLVAKGIYDSLAHRVLRDEATATALGLSADDRISLAMLMDEPMLDAALPADWYSRAVAVAAKLDALWSGDLLTAAEAKKLRAKYKTDLARHRRNAGKYGI